MTFETDAVKLLVRWQGLGQPLTDLERELLLVNLYEENRTLRGHLYQQAHEQIEKYRMQVKKGQKVTWQTYREQ